MIALIALAVWKRPRMRFPRVDSVARLAPSQRDLVIARSVGDFVGVLDRTKPERLRDRRRLHRALRHSLRSDSHEPILARAREQVAGAQARACGHLQAVVDGRSAAAEAPSRFAEWERLNGESRW